MAEKPDFRPLPHLARIDYGFFASFPRAKAAGIYGLIVGKRKENHKDAQRLLDMAWFDKQRPEAEQKSIKR